VKDFLKIIRFIKNYRKQAVLVVINNILYVLFNLASLILFIPFLRLIFNTGEATIPKAPGVPSLTKQYVEEFYNYEMYQFVQERGKLDALALICVTILVCFLLKNFFRYFAMFYLAEIRTGVVRDLRNTIHQKMIRLKLSFFSEERKGDLMARAMNDVQEIEISVMGTLELIFREPLAIILTLTFLFLMSWELTLFSLVLLPVSAFIISKIGRSLKRTSKKAQDRLGRLSAALEESLSSIRIIKAFNGQDRLHDKFEQYNNDYRNTATRAYRKRDLASPLNEFMGAGVMVSLVWFGGSIVLKDQTLSGDTFLGFIVLFSQLLVPVQGIANSVSNVNKGLASIERINKVLNAPNEEEPNKENALPIKFETSIIYKDVDFMYGNSDDYALKGINIELKKGKTLALVGESGGGKSTLADLLPRFYDCTSGKITIDAINIKDATLFDLRKIMGIVTQESILFNDSVFENIAFGSDHATKESVIEAAKIANAHRFIDQLPQGYDTNIGDKGSKLSGGQRQRLNIARAVLKNPEILILDEATSALDTESEQLVQEALEKLMKNRTSMVIAHRLSTIKYADEIAVIVKGEIVERGVHQDLYEANGVYRKLCDLQSFS